MKTSPLLLRVILFIVLTPLAPAAGQEGGAGHFSKDGLSFDYPKGWTVAENSDERLQGVTLRRAGVSNVITVLALREPVATPAQLYAARNSVTAPYVEGVARRLGLEKAPPPEETRCVEVGGRFAVGFRMEGRVREEPTTAEVYTIALGRRLLHLVHIRNNRDEAQGEGAWRTLLGTLKVEPPASAPPGADEFGEVVMGGVLDGRALQKPKPNFRGRGWEAWARGRVVVQVLVDEKGDVVAARAASGPGPLREASEEAARLAKFAPAILCGRAVKVSGLLTYDYVLR